MSKSKLLTFAVIALFVINIVTLSFFIFNAPGERDEMHGKGPRLSPREIIIDRLQFDEKQVAEYDELIKEHSAAVSNLDHQIVELKNSLYSALLNPDDKTVTDNLFSQIASRQAAIERVHFNHFQDIKKLCKPGQMEDYKALTNELAKLFNPKLPPKGKHHGHHP